MKSILKNNRFLFILGSECFAVLSFSIFVLAISWYMVDGLNHPQYMGLVMAAAALPRMFTMIIGGVLADRIQKSKILFGTSLGKVILLGILLWVYINGELTFSVILILSFFIGSLDGLFFPALSSLIPSLVNKKDLQLANTLIHSSQELLFLIGPVLAGVLINYYSFAATFAVCVITMSVNMCLVFPAFVRDEKPSPSEKKLTFLKEFVEGYHYIRKSSIYTVGIAIIIVLNFFVLGPIFLSLPILAKETGGSALDLSFLEAGFSIGSLSATMILLIFSVNKQRGRLILLFLLSAVIFLGIFSQMPSMWGLVLLVMLIGFFSFMTFIPADVMIQEHTEPQLMGRVMAIVFIAQTAFDPISQTLFSSLMTIGFSVRTLLFIFAAVGLGLTILIVAKAKQWTNKQSVLNKGG
ncbi:MFS transporter [Bacillus sp. CLL-7-23]|uniref:MFS transporter n=1 Tax=Bacillus changyiensis TaxID=3004103 RepID=A0ABT4X5D0_9BACI|nr:MFS transporter [Bacillus changyiensis]MDA7026587.1 MFS transporter [Bacillus changyiensis]